MTRATLAEGKRCRLCRRLPNASLMCAGHLLRAACAVSELIELHHSTHACRSLWSFRLLVHCALGERDETTRSSEILTTMLAWAQ
jgi:hypothetical protein